MPTTKIMIANAGNTPPATNAKVFNSILLIRFAGFYKQPFGLGNPAKR
jgi:hypothetical protein